MTQHPTETRRAAIALKYDAATDNAPRVVAKGRGLVAEKIIALAQAQGIPMREDPDLVQMLTQIDLDHEIPPTLYKVVAELLAFVYRLNQRYQAPLGP
jgi:flagellar biosynthesis protein